MIDNNTKKEAINFANESGEILKQTRKEKARRLAQIFGTPENLHEFQEYLLPELNPAKRIKGQADPFASVNTEGVPMEYIGYQFSVLAKAQSKLLAVMEDIEKAFEPETEKKENKHLRK